MAEHRHHSINYIELPLRDSDATKAFYTSVFGWSFEDYGPDYLAFAGAGVDGGFDRQGSLGATGSGVLVVLYSQDLEATLSATKNAGAMISKETFSFPGGRRFHFIDPNGVELAVWSE